jgi:hypothetical protein
MTHLLTTNSRPNMLTNFLRSISLGRQSVRVASAPRSTSFWELWRVTNISRSVWTKDFWCLFDSTTLHLCCGQISRLSTTCMMKFTGMKLTTLLSLRKTTNRKIHLNFKKSNASEHFWSATLRRDSQLHWASIHSRTKSTEQSKRSIEMFGKPWWVVLWGKFVNSVAVKKSEEKRYLIWISFK